MQVLLFLHSSESGAELMFWMDEENVSRNFPGAQVFSVSGLGEESYFVVPGHGSVEASRVTVSWRRGNLVLGVHTSEPVQFEELRQVVMGMDRRAMQRAAICKVC